MPSLVPHAGLALLVAIGLLGHYYSKRALALVLVVLVLPELDTVLGLVIDGAHRTLFHNLLLPGVLAILLTWDERQGAGWVRRRFGATGVRLAWVALLVHTFTHVFLDWTHLEGVNLLWPLHDQFFKLEGELYLSSTDGLVQTFIDITTDPQTGERTIEAGGGGSRTETQVANPVQPGPEAQADPAERRFLLVNQGWQLYLVFVGLFAVLARKLQDEVNTPDGGD
ncbi:MAG: metal-dependent hydrolase [Halobacteriales archaeon]